MLTSRAGTPPPYQVTLADNTTATVVADTLVITSDGTQLSATTASGGFSRHMAERSGPGISYTGSLIFGLSSGDVTFKDALLLDASLIDGSVSGNTLTVTAQSGAALVYTRR